MKVRVGIVGVGHRGIQIARSAAALDDVTVAALADLDEGRLNDAANEFGVDRTFTLLSQMLESVDLDAVLVLTPDPAYTVEDTQAMADAADRAGRHMMVAWNRTFGLTRAKEVFGADGPEVAMADFVRPGPTYLALIRIHIVNPFHFMCGLPSEIAAQGEMHDGTQEGNLLASMRFSGGALGQMTASHGTGGHSERFTAYGGGWSVFIDSTGRGNGRIVRGGEVVEELPPVDTVAAQMRHFIDCVKTDTRPLNSGQDAVEVMRMTYAIMDAAGFGVPPPPGDTRGWLLWCGCGAKVMKNWLPFVFGPAFAIESEPVSWTSSEWNSSSKR